MKEKILYTLKKAQQNKTIFNVLVLGLIFFLFINLSIIRNGLFLKEIILCFSVVCLSVLNSNK